MGYWNYYDVYDMEIDEIIIEKARISDVAKALQCEPLKVSRAAQRQREGRGKGVIDKRYQLINIHKAGFEVTDEKGEAKSFEEEWEKVKELFQGINKEQLRKIRLVGVDNE